MIKVLEDKCEIEGYKADIMTEVQIIIMNLLTHLDPIDKYIMLHMITTTINKSLEGEDNDD